MIVKKLDKIEYKLMPTFITSEGEKSNLVHIFINNIDLVEIIKKHEYSWLEQNNPSKLSTAGSYAIPSNGWLYKNLKSYNDDALIYACGDCLDEGCWSMGVNIVKNNGIIVWSNFYSSLEGCDYSKIVSFQFDEKQYNHELEKIKAQ